MSFRLERVLPTSLQVGEIVDVRVAFSAFPTRTGTYVFRPILRAVISEDAQFVQVCILSGTCGLGAYSVSEQVIEFILAGARQCHDILAVQETERGR